MKTVYCDGAGWNGHLSSYAVVNAEGKPIVHKTFQRNYTNNEMEYTAVWVAAQIVKPDTRIVTDSQLVVNQVKGLWSIKEGKFHRVAEEIRRLMREKNLTLEWVPRRKNLAGIFLEKVKKLRKKATT